MSRLESPRIRQVREEWRSNPRLRWGVAAVAVIAALYLLLVLVDWRRDLHQQYQQRTLQLYKMAALAGQEQWSVRAQTAQNLEKSLQAEIPRAATIGLAQAEVQASIRQVLNAFGPKLSSDARPPVQVRAQPGLWRIPVTIRGLVGQAQLMEILRRIESSDRLVVIDDFQIGFAQGQPNITLTAVAYYRVGPAQGGQRVVR
jgi:Type II secretion system (T2SS), protein M subtype b